MSELIRAFIEAIPAFMLSTRHRPSVLGTTISQLGQEIAAQVDTVEQVAETGIQPRTATRLLSFDRALKTQELSQLGAETTKRLSPETTAARGSCCIS